MKYKHVQNYYLHLLTILHYYSINKSQITKQRNKLYLYQQLRLLTSILCLDKKINARCFVCTSNAVPSALASKLKTLKQV